MRDQCRGQARKRKATDKFAAWLAAGTIAVGLSAAAVSGAAVTYADTGSSGSASHSTSDSANTSTSQHDSAGSARKAVGKPAPRVKAAGGAKVTDPSERALSLVTTTGSATPKASATPQLPTPQSILSDITRQIDYIFFNKTPTINPTGGTQSGPDKVITGALNGTSNNGFGLFYSIANAPKYGTAYVDPNTGVYTYTANTDLIQPGISDSFVVRVDNGTRAALPGLLGQLQFALHSMAIALGIAKPDALNSTISVTVTGTNQYGNPAGNAEWWQQQTIDNDCVLIAVASAVGQLSGTMPSEATIVTVAKNTMSVVNPPNPMYVGPKSETSFGGVALPDAVALLKQYGLAAQLVTYVDDPLPGETPNKATLEDGARALRDVEAALASGQAVIAIVNAQIIYTAAGNAYPTPFFEANHAILVTGVDISTGKVYVNDGNLMTGSTAISIGAFMWGWMGSDFNTIYAQKPAQSAAAAIDNSLAA